MEELLDEIIRRLGEQKVATPYAEIMQDIITLAKELKRVRSTERDNSTRIARLEQGGFGEPKQ